MTQDNLTFVNAYGTKSFTLDQYPPEAWQFISGDPDGNTDAVKTMWAAVPWLYQAVNIISQATGEVPVSLYRGDTEVTSSEDWQDVTGYLPDIARLMRKVAAALVLEGQGYLFRDEAKTIRAVKNLVYWNPTTVKVNWRLTKTRDLIYFDRSANGKVTTYTNEQVIYFWPDDGYTELGPPASSPAKAALSAAGVLYNADKYVQAYWERGAVKAMLLAVEGNPSADEKKKLTDWWKSITGGVRKAFNVFTLNAKAVTPTVVGDGLEGLQNTELTKEKREDISTALGVPQSILFSSDAGGLGGAGVVAGDRVKLFELTVIPLVRLICGVLNEQQLVPNGYRLVVNENEMPMYQEDEAQRAQALQAMISALSSPEEFLLSADILGFELDDEIRARIEAMIAGKEERAAQVQQQMQPSAPVDVEDDMEDDTEDDDEDDMMAKWQPDIDRWRRKALRVGKDAEFASELIPANVRARIEAKLAQATNDDEIKAAFDMSEPRLVQPVQDDTALRELAESIKAAMAVVNQPDPQPQPINITVNTPEQKYTVTIPENNVTVNVPEQPAPQVTINTPPVTVNVPETKIENNVTVQPAEVQLPPLPTEATITVDNSGRKILKVK